MSRITDHALVRWLTRVRGIDMEELRVELETIVKPYADLRVKHIEIGGFWFVFNLNGDLVTVTDSRPRLNSMHSNDRDMVNGTHHPHEPMPWQARKRRRRG